MKIRIVRQDGIFFPQYRRHIIFGIYGFWKYFLHDIGDAAMLNLAPTPYNFASYAEARQFIKKRGFLVSDIV